MVGIRLFPFGMAYFQVRTVSFREGILTWPSRLNGFPTFWDYIFSRENKPFKGFFFQGTGRLSEFLCGELVVSFFCCVCE